MPGQSTGGGGATASCIYLIGALYVNINNIFSDSINGGTMTLNTGGDPPNIHVDYSSNFSNVAVTMSGIAINNDGSQLQDTGAYIILNNCYNCFLTQSSIGASGPGLPADAWYGNVGLEFEGPGQALNVTQVLFSEYGSDASIKLDAQGSPSQLNFTNNDFDYCGNYCLAIINGSAIVATTNQFAGEGNSPWLLSNNVGIYGSSSFVGGPNVFSANTFVNFSNGSAYAMRFTGTLANTTVSGNQGVTNSTFLSGTAGSGSAFGQNCSGSPSGSFSTFNGVVGHC